MTPARTYELELISRLAYIRRSLAECGAELHPDTRDYYIEEFHYTRDLLADVRAHNARYNIAPPVPVRSTPNVDDYPHGWAMADTYTPQ